MTVKDLSDKELVDLKNAVRDERKARAAKRKDAAKAEKLLKLEKQIKELKGEADGLVR